MNEALRARDQTQAQRTRYEQAQNDRDGIYESIFLGPSPGFSMKMGMSRGGQCARHALRDYRRHAGEGRAQSVRQ